MFKTEGTETAYFELYFKYIYEKIWREKVNDLACS